jgi:hypothetical protein
MTTKLTLTVEKQVIQRAKRYAKRQKQSLSQIVTTYLDHLSTEADISAEIDSEVLSASDSIRLDQIPDLKEAKYRYLKEKHLHG